MRRLAQLSFVRLPSWSRKLTKQFGARSSLHGEVMPASRWVLVSAVRDEKDYICTVLCRQDVQNGGNSASEELKKTTWQKHFECCPSSCA